MNTTCPTCAHDEHESATCATADCRCGTGFIASRASLARHLGINLAESDARARSLDAPATYERSDTTREAVESWLASAPEATGTLAFSPPYTTPVPTLHDGSTGFIFCEACDAPQPVAGHECATSRREPLSFLVEAAKQQERAEFAENLLMAMAFDHQRSNFVGIADFYLCLPLNSCALCTAARGGGR